MTWNGICRRPEQLIPEEDWQRAIRHDLDALHRMELAQANREHLREFFEGFRQADSIHDAQALDPAPDRCWRCDASPGADDLGLCEPCKASLTRGTG